MILTSSQTGSLTHEIIAFPAAIQGDRGGKAINAGELFGCANLLKMTSQTIETVNIVTDQAIEPQLFRIEQVDIEEIGIPPPPTSPLQISYQPSPPLPS